MDIAAIASALCKQEFIAADWTEKHLLTWLRDGGKCTYCHVNLLENRGIAYYFYSYDHVLPKHRYPKFEHVPENLVLSCRECNAIKGKFDPNKKSPIFNAESGESPNDAGWRELVRRAAAHVRETRPQREQQFDKGRKAILEALKVLANDQRRTTDDEIRT